MTNGISLNEKKRKKEQQQQNNRNMMRKIPNYEYRGNRNNKNSSDSSSGCEDDFDADDSYVNDSSELDYCKEMNTAIETSLNLNHSPMPHFPPPPDYPPPGSLSSVRSQQQTQQRSRYYYYENGKSEMNSNRGRRVGSLDRDCGYTTDGNEICSRQTLNHHENGGHSANNSFSSTSSSNNSSVVMHKTKKLPQTQTRYPTMSDAAHTREPTVTINGCHNLDASEIYTNEQEKRIPFKPQSATTTKTNKNRLYLDAMRTMNQSSKVNVMSTAELEQNSIRLGESAASIAREAKILNNSEPEVKWMRNNISATMERFHPSPSTSKHSNGVEHLYQQIDESPPRSQYEFNPIAGPSKPPPPNSMRALLMTANRNAYRMSPTMRHMYTNRYGTQENIYEEISSEERLRLLSAGHSMMSLQGTSVEEEFRRVQNRHRRILGELNLSVEAMLMPATPPDSPEPVEPTEVASASESQTRLNELLNVVGPTDELLSPVSIHATIQNNTCDIDSGFSGSSSGGASYLGSLRYKNGLPMRSSTPNGHSSASSCRSSQRSNEDPGILMISSRSSALYRNGVVNGNNMMHTISKSHRYHSAEDPGPHAHFKDGKVIVNGMATASKSSFWSRKSWRKFPGFSSNTSVNKAGLSNDRTKIIAAKHAKTN